MIFKITLNLSLCLFKGISGARDGVTDFSHSVIKTQFEGTLDVSIEKC